MVRFSAPTSLASSLRCRPCSPESIDVVSSPRSSGSALALILAAQRTKIAAYCTMHDLQLAEVIVDAGHSAKSLDRPGMTRLLDLIRRRDHSGSRLRLSHTRD